MYPRNIWILQTTDFMEEKVQVDSLSVLSCCLIGEVKPPRSFSYL